MEVLLTFQQVCKIAFFGSWQFVSDILSQMELQHYAWENSSPWAPPKVFFPLPSHGRRGAVFLGDSGTRGLGEVRIQETRSEILVTQITF